jgi:hypothetical protein
LYDASNKRFAQTDPVGGSVTITLSLNAYLYCSDDPVNNIDPTGLIMPGDELLSVQKQAEIAVFTKQWEAANAKGDSAGKAAAHAAPSLAEGAPTCELRTARTKLPQLVCNGEGIANEFIRLRYALRTQISCDILIL